MLRKTEIGAAPILSLPPIVLAVAVGIFTSSLACTFGEDCTAVGCLGQARVRLVSDKSWPAGEYSFTLLLGDRKSSCTTTLPRPNATQGSADDCSGPEMQVTASRPNATVDNSKLQPLQGEAFDIVVYRQQEKSRPDVSLRVEYEGSVVVERLVELSWDTIYPNGPDCDPGCNQGEATINVSLP